MSDRELPPGVVAELDQHFAEADEKYEQLVHVLSELAAEYGMYEAVAVMAKSLDIASHETLVSMVVTGMRREVLHGGKESSG